MVYPDDIYSKNIQLSTIELSKYHPSKPNKHHMPHTTLSVNKETKPTGVFLNLNKL
jgi:hypothetical protein